MTKEERRDKFLKEHPEWKFGSPTKGWVKKVLEVRECLLCKQSYMPTSFTQKYCAIKCLRKAQKRKCTKEDKFKQWARWRVWFAVDRKLIIKPKLCEGCGQEKVLQGHHEEYSKPLDVIWLCITCHKIADKKLL